MNSWIGAWKCCRLCVAIEHLCCCWQHGCLSLCECWMAEKFGKRCEQTTWIEENNEVHTFVVGDQEHTDEHGVCSCKDYWWCRYSHVLATKILYSFLFVAWLGVSLYHHSWTWLSDVVPLKKWPWDLPIVLISKVTITMVPRVSNMYIWTSSIPLTINCGFRFVNLLLHLTTRLFLKFCNNSQNTIVIHIVILIVHNNIWKVVTRN